MLFFLAIRSFSNFKGIWWCFICCCCLFVFVPLEAWIREGTCRRLMRLLNPTRHSRRHSWFRLTLLNDCSPYKLQKFSGFFSLFQSRFATCTWTRKVFATCRHSAIVFATKWVPCTHKVTILVYVCACGRWHVLFCAICVINNNRSPRQYYAVAPTLTGQKSAPNGAKVHAVVNF